MRRKPKRNSRPKEKEVIRKTPSKPDDLRDSRKQDEKLDTTRSNNPTWYFADEKLADQVSQLSFQQLAGYPISYDGKDMDVPNLVQINLNPSPGVQLSRYYGTTLIQNSGINLAGFKLYSKLSTYTGRTASYAPQDISTMILAFGEVISCVEWIRRAFGVAYTMNMRNRDYPKQVLRFGMCIDADDLFTHLSDYRTQFNAMLTLINQLPIPKGIPYFDKCAALYERLYLDSPSAMAQTLIPNPFTTWVLDEKAIPSGSVLKTVPWIADPTTPQVGRANPVNMSVFLNQLQALISAVLNSTSLQTVYMDLLNYAAKVGQEFWKFDYLFEEYQVVPEYDQNFLLQMHNATIITNPISQTTLVTGAANVTPYNDVYPDVNNNALYYNPAFLTVGAVAQGMGRTGNEVLIDMLSDQVSVTDRVEVTRYSSIGTGTPFQPSGATSANTYIDCVLPDHYVCCVKFESQTTNLTYHEFTSSIQAPSSFLDLSAQIANIDWAPRIFECTSNSTGLTGHYTGDVNFYTTVGAAYLRKLHDFVGLHLYDLG